MSRLQRLNNPPDNVVESKFATAFKSRLDHQKNIDTGKAILGGVVMTAAAVALVVSLGNMILTGHHLIAVGKGIGVFGMRPGANTGVKKSWWETFLWDGPVGAGAGGIADFYTLGVTA